MRRHRSPAGAGASGCAEWASPPKRGNQIVAFDLIIRGGSVVDGTGAPARTADVGVTDGVITEVGHLDGPARRTIDADGALVTPGFVDIHTHYDGQATWDERLAPSSA